MQRIFDCAYGRRLALSRRQYFRLHGSRYTPCYWCYYWCRTQTNMVRGRSIDMHCVVAASSYKTVWSGHILRNSDVITHWLLFAGRYKLVDAQPPLVDKEGYAWCLTLEQLEHHVCSGNVKISGYLFMPGEPTDKTYACCTTIIHGVSRC